MGNRKSRLAPLVVADLTKTTHFTPIELNDLYRQYQHDCNLKGHGFKLTMNMNEFKNIYRDIFPDGDADKFSEHVFRTYDNDCNGVIDFKEFITLLNIQLKGTYEDKLTWLFDLYDLDRSNEISYDEAYEVISVLFDLNSGLIPSEDNINPKQLTEYLFTKANESHQGIVDRQFFYNAAIQSKPLRILMEATAKCASQPYTLRKERSGSFGRKNISRSVIRMRKEREPESEQHENERDRSDSLHSSKVLISV